MATPLHNYPGINLDLCYYPQQNNPFYPIGAHHNCWGSESELLPIREAFMMILMDRLTDKVDWHKKVLDEEIVAKWRKEALEQPEDDLYSQITENKNTEHYPKPRGRVLSGDAFDYCIKELRGKAVHFANTGLVHTLDSVSAKVIKSDTVVVSELRRDLRTAFDKLRSDQVSQVDWHPRSDEMVQDLVHPSMYPFIYGRSMFLQDEVVGVSDAVELWSGKGETAKRQDSFGDPNSSNENILRGNGHELHIGGSSIPPEYWSDKYQWLPANLAFREDGSVKFTSYINNLHPKKYPEIYRTIERIIETAIPAWDQCLAEYNNHKTISSGLQKSRFSWPGRFGEDDERQWEPFNAKVLEQHYVEHRDEGPRQWELEDAEEDYYENDEEKEREVQKVKWKHTRDAILPEPDKFTEVDYLCKESLRDKFKATGLQVIVKMATIELTPEKPEFPLGGWHIEGQMNERICATALYYLDSENVTPSHLSFRMQTSSEQNHLEDVADQDDYNWLERVYATSFGSASGVPTACIQNYGSVETREGRLLAFPNVMQHRVSPFKLQDPTKPGHRRFIALWLVDPHQRIVSTANVPPQQLDWWAEAVFGANEQAKRGEMPPQVFQLLQEQGLAEKFPPNDSVSSHDTQLPAEILQMVRKEGIMPEGLMTVDEARKHRVELMNVRSRFHDKSDSSWQSVEYSFCEH